jgi:predicted aldo/keto reductase-like oxidoreductase
MKQVTLGRTGITVPQNGFGMLPLQRISVEAARALLRRAYDGGMRFFDTAHGYTDSEYKFGKAFPDGRGEIVLATKTHVSTPEKLRADLEQSLHMMKTDHIDVFQLHQIPKVFRPDDGTGIYEELLRAKEEGLILHIGFTAHKIDVAEEGIASGLYETVQYPMSYLATDRELDLVRKAKEADMGFICMKGLAGGLLTRSDVCMAFMTQFDNAVPIWGIQRENELDEWLSYMDDTPELNEEMQAFIAKERAELAGDFCRSCGYCMPCPVGIEIRNCARMSQLIRRSPSEQYFKPAWQEKMRQIEDCLECYQCASKCPYGLDTPKLLKKNYEDYQRVLRGEISVR